MPDTLLAARVACHSHHSSGGAAPSAQPQTFAATLMDAAIERTADGQSVPVGGLPAQGATLTVR